MEKTIASKEIYNGKVIKVYLDDIITANDIKAKREVVKHNGGACIALKENDKYFMVKQYRYAHAKEMLEFCAGKIEIGEEPDQTILRETKEELGYELKNLISLGYIIPTCGYSSEKIYLYYGEANKKVNQKFDEDEDINVYKYTFQEIKEMIKDGTIDDAKTIALMYKIEMEGLDA